MTTPTYEPRVGDDVLIPATVTLLNDSQVAVEAGGIIIGWARDQVMPQIIPANPEPTLEDGDIVADEGGEVYQVHGHPANGVFVRPGSDQRFMRARIPGRLRLVARYADLRRRW